MNCYLCWHPEGKSYLMSKHNPECPVASGLSEEQSKAFQEEWNKGYIHAFNHGEVYTWRDLKNFSHAFQYGYRVGRAELDELVYEAVVSRQFGC